MAKRTRWWGWAGLGGAAFLAWSGSAAAAPTPAQILAFTPRQPGVECTTPSAEQQSSCKVSLLKDKKGSGWVMTDAAGQTASDVGAAAVASTAIPRPFAVAAAEPASTARRPGRARPRRRRARAGPRTRRRAPDSRST